MFYSICSGVLTCFPLILSNYENSSLAHSRKDFVVLFGRVYKMFSRGNFVTFVIAINLILLVFFFAFKERVVNNNACTYGQTCIRFCCDNEDLCRNNIIQTYFNASGIPKNTGKYETDVKLMFGRPPCRNLKKLGCNQEWKFTYVRLARSCNAKQFLKRHFLSTAASRPKSIQGNIFITLLMISVLRAITTLIVTPLNGILCTARTTMKYASRSITFVSNLQLFERKM